MWLWRFYVPTPNGPDELRPTSSAELTDSGHAERIRAIGVAAFLFPHFLLRVS